MTTDLPDGTFAPSPAHTCPVCGFVTRSAFFARMHQRSAHPTPEQQFAAMLAVAAERSLYRAEAARQQNPNSFGQEEARG